MSDEKQTHTNAQTETHQKTQGKKAGYSKTGQFKDSAQQIYTIALEHGLEASLRHTSPENSVLNRALNRERQRRERQQQNLEQIIKLAHTACSNELAGQPSADWLYRFFDLAHEIHTPSMQTLWAQILKKEVMNPGTTSIKTLHILHGMAPKEAQILQRAASLSCYFGNDQSRKLLLGYKQPQRLLSFGKRTPMHNVQLGAFQLPYSSLLILIELGLLHAAELESGEIAPGSPLLIHYQGQTLSLQVNNRGVSLIYYRFTPAGSELCQLLGNTPNSAYYDQLTTILNQTFTTTSDC